MVEKTSNKTRVLPVMILIMALLAVPYWIVKARAWNSAGVSKSASPIRDPDELPVIHQIADFSFTNQLGKSIQRSDLLGHVWVAAVIFTRCPGPCAMMTAHMADLQREIPHRWPVHFVSITADVDHDVPEVLRTYAEHYQANADRWHFLHGHSKSDVVDLVVNNLKLIVLDKGQEKESPNDLFIHSTVFALVDRQGRLRGTFESIPAGLSEDSNTANSDSWETQLKPRLLRAIEQMIHED